MNFKLFHEAAKENKEILPIKAEHIELVSNFAYPIICKDASAFVKYREKFIRNNVEIRPIVGGNMAAQPFFKK